MKRSAITPIDRSVPNRAADVVSTEAPPESPTWNADVSPRRLLGAFYTPDALAVVLTRWALAGGPGTVLDPSYGGCAFLRAAVNILRDQQVSEPERLVFGVDIDRNCIRYAAGLIARRNCITADFLALRPENVSGTPFKAIVGNPPYVRHHWLRGARRRAAARVAERAGIDLHATASTWAYFVLHSLDFLAMDGRMVLLVPEAILQVDYAKAVRDLLQRRFARVGLVHVRDRIFSDTREAVVVIAADGVGPGTIRTESVESAEDLTVVLESRGNASPKRAVISNGRHVDTAVIDLLNELGRLPLVSTLGDIATIRIGFVTGSNDFFIRSQKDIQRRRIPGRATQRVVRRTQWLTGLEFTSDDHVRLANLGRRAFLVRPTATTRHHTAVKAWINEGAIEGIHRRHKCEAREPWYEVDPGPRPDAFVTCSRMGPPLLVLNQAGYRCSNALHRLQWRDTLAVSPTVLPVTFLSSLTAVWAEIHGRRYGGGVLKLEPGTLRSIPIALLPSLSTVFEDIDTMMRSGHEEHARRAADEIVLRAGLGISAKDLSRLERARRDLAEQRAPIRNGRGDG